MPAPKLPRRAATRVASMRMRISRARMASAGRPSWCDLTAPCLKAIALALFWKLGSKERSDGAHGSHRTGALCPLSCGPRGRGDCRQRRIDRIQCSGSLRVALCADQILVDLHDADLRLDIWRRKI